MYLSEASVTLIDNENKTISNATVTITIKDPRKPVKVEAFTEAKDSTGGTVVGKGCKNGYETADGFGCCDDISCGNSKADTS